MGFLLTYPRCPLQPEDALKQIMGCHQTPIKDYVVARENHADGTPHIHAYIRYEAKVTWKPNLWDIGGHHGNYQVAKSARGSYAYCTKENDWISNIQVENALGKRASRNLQLINGNARELVLSGEIGLLQLPLLQKAKLAFDLLAPPHEHDDIRGIWVVGKPGVGKSYWVRSQCPGLFLKAQNKWWDGYAGQEAALLDDLDTDVLAHYLKIWADRYACTGEVKGGHVNLHHRAFYVTSNFSIEELFKALPEVTISAIRRRFKVIRMLDWNSFMTG